jgi:photosystem II stability/assembly factor-like uncharacterized protein
LLLHSIYKPNGIAFSGVLKKTKTMKKQVLFLLTCILFSRQLSGQWESHGPFGGVMSSVISSGGAVFVGTSNGVFKSTDNGLTYMAANKGLERTMISMLSANSSGIYAATWYNGVYFSSDNGNSWTNRSNGITDLHVTSVFANASGVYAGTPDGVFFSSNNGLTWTLANSGIPSTYDIYSWAQMGDTVYAATYGLGVYRSSNNGGVWTQVSGGLPAPTSPSMTSFFVYALYADGNNMFAGTSGGIYKSMDRGLTWSSSNTGMPSGMWARAFISKPGFIFAGTHTEGVFVSTDNGVSWTAMNNGIMNWPKNNGLPHNYPTVNALATSGSAVLAATSEGMYRSTDNGTSWTYANTGILATDVVSVAHNGTTAFAGTSRSGVFISSDHGMTWSRSTTGLPTPEVVAVATSSNRAFVSLLNHKVYASSNQGVSWTSASNGLPADVYLMAATDTKIYAITNASKYTMEKLYVSLDYGQNWTQIVGAYAISGGMTAIAAYQERIYIGTANGVVYRSDDNGTSWRDIGSYLPTVKITAILALGDETFVGTAGKGVFKFTGDDYNMMSGDPGLTNPNITDLAIQDDMLFASTWGGGIFSSGNHGQSWFATNEGLGDQFVYSLAGEATKMFAGSDAGAYQTQSDAFAKFAIMSGLNTNAKDRLVVYPNPASGVINIVNNFSVFSEIVITDLSGREIQKVSIPAETTQLVDLQSFNRGLYMLKIRAGSYESHQKIVLE